MAEDDFHTEFKVTYHDSRRAGRLALVTMDNGQDHRQPNTFGQQALTSLEAALDEVERQDDVTGLLLTGKPFVFAAGADLDMFVDASGEFGREAAARGHAAFRRLADLGFPTLAAINGVAMGGGLEIALHCDYRTVSTAAKALAFPEVFLSIVPAWGGTQLAPRLVGAEHALTAILFNALNNNRTMAPAEAHRLGFADWLVEAVDFLDTSVATLEGLVTGDIRAERASPGENLDEVLAQARAFADQKVRGATPAPYAAIDLVEHAARGGDLAEGYRREEDALAELLPGRHGQAAVYSFNLTQRRIKRQPWRPDAEARPLNRIGVVGAGLMGAQLGALFLHRLEVPVVLKDVDQRVLDAAQEHVEGELDKRVERGRQSPGKARFLKSLVTYTLEDAPLEGADFVIEAVLEQMSVKKSVFADVEKLVDADAILATNTSSLSVAEMAADLHHPERVVGFHFFNPVAVMPFLEIVRSRFTNDTTVATAFEASKQLRKSGVACADTRGFIVNRLLTRFNNACLGALRHGNDFPDVDAAVKDLGLPMGPFELLGFVGLRVALHTAETLAGAYPDRFAVDDTFRRIAELDVDGIYDWAHSDPTRPTPHAEVAAAVEVDRGAEPLSADEIRRRAIEAVADEAKTMLDEGVVADPRDLDTGLLLGAGWPFFMGGICKYADQTGVSDRLFGHPLLPASDRAAVS